MVVRANTAVARADPRQRFRLKDEIVSMKFDTLKGSFWNYSAVTPSPSDATFSLSTVDGQQVLRIDMTDTCTSAFVGVTTGKSLTNPIPNDWNGEYAAVYCIPDKFQSINSVTLYLGDAANTNNWSKTINIGGALGTDIYSTTLPWHHNSWHTQKWRTGPANPNSIILDASTASNSPTIATAVGARLKFTKNAGAGTACTVYVAWMGIPAMQRPQVMWTFDHASISQYQNLWPLAKAKKMPIAIGIQSDPIKTGSAQHMTPENLKEMYNDPSGLAEFYSYARALSVTSIKSMSLDAYLADYDSCTDYLRSLGVKNPTLFLPYPYGDYNDDVMNAIWARGCRIGRRVDGAGSRHNDTASCFQGKQMLSMDCSMGPGVGMTIAQAKAWFDFSLTKNEHVLTICHDVPNAGDYTTAGWPVDYWSQLFDHAIMRQNQGLCDIVSVEQFYNKLTNPRYGRGVR